MRKIFIILGIVTFLIWFFFPVLFKLWVFNVLVKPPFTTAHYTDLGPIGDIFGGLTALFTSATLIIVMYSAYLQREANKDARESMDKQLKQARSATAKQLLQARRALKLQLEQANDSTKKQIDLAQASHDAQIKESRYAIFINNFNFLLNFKHERFINIQTYKDDESYNSYEVFSFINLKMVSHLNKEWRDISKVTRKKVQDDYFTTLHQISHVKNYSEIFSYFNSLKELYRLINRSNLDERDKKFYKSIVRGSMSTGEQAALFWAGVFRRDIRALVEKESCFLITYEPYLMPFITKFYDKNCFANSEIIKNWDLHKVENENPA